MVFFNPPAIPGDFSTLKGEKMPVELPGYATLGTQGILVSRSLITPFHNYSFNLFWKMIMHHSYPCIGAQKVLRDYKLCFAAAPMPLISPESGEYAARCIHRWIEESSYNSGQRTLPTNFISMAIVFPEMAFASESEAEKQLWQFLARVHYYDKNKCGWSSESSSCVYDPVFSMSIGGFAHFIPFMSPVATTLSRWFPYPLVVFNPHFIFRKLREVGLFARWRDIIRQREKIAQGGWQNPKLADYGETGLEAPQYALTLDPIFDVGPCPFTGKKRPTTLGSYSMQDYPFVGNRWYPQKYFWDCAR